MKVNCGPKNWITDLITHCLEFVLQQQTNGWQAILILVTGLRFFSFFSLPLSISFSSEQRKWFSNSESEMLLTQIRPLSTKWLSELWAMCRVLAFLTAELEKGAFCLLVVFCFVLFHGRQKGSVRGRISLKRMSQLTDSLSGPRTGSCWLHAHVQPQPIFLRAPWKLLSRAFVYNEVKTGRYWVQELVKGGAHKNAYGLWEFQVHDQIYVYN